MNTPELKTIPLGDNKELCINILPKKLKMCIYYPNTGKSFSLPTLRHEELSTVITELLKIERESKEESVMYDKLKELKRKRLNS